MDAQASADALAVLKFEEGKQSRQAEIDALLAKIAELEAAPQTPGGFTQEQVDQMLEPLQKKIAELEGKVAESDAKIIELEQKISELNLQKEAEILAAVEAKVAELVAEFEAAEVDNAALIAKYKKV